MQVAGSEQEWATKDRETGPARPEVRVPGKDSGLTLVKGRRRVRVCVIDDDERMLSAVRELLEGQRYETLGLNGALGTTAKATDFKPDIILLDLDLPFIRGPELWKLLQRQLQYRPLVILFSGAPPEELERIAQEIDADDFFYKGSGLHRLLGRIHLHAFELNRSCPPEPEAGEKR